jgi:hypothetical protein
MPTDRGIFQVRSYSIEDWIEGNGTHQAYQNYQPMDTLEQVKGSMKSLGHSGKETVQKRIVLRIYPNHSIPVRHMSLRSSR